MGQAHRGAFEGRDVGKVARCLVKPFPIAEACEIVRVAAIGLDYAHANGIVHRDIKPSNLMVNRQGAVKILDFGLVQLDGWSGATLEVTSVGQLLGTLDYMAPEQADRADSADHRSDIYSLGATLFRLLAGRAPFAANANQSPLEKLRLLANERPPRILTLRPDLPPSLATIIDKTLDRDPHNRPASAAHLAELLQPFCESADVAKMMANVDEQTADAVDDYSRYSRPLELSPDRLAVSTKKQLSASRSSGSRWRAMKYLIGLAAFAGLVWAGIVLVLDTQKGQVVIETDSDNLHVQLVSESGARKEIELVPGENSTRIYAGRYEIQIDDGTDRYVIDQNSFLLKRGEKVVAKVTVNAGEKKAEVTWSDNSRPKSSAPIAPIEYTEPSMSPEQLNRETVVVYSVKGDAALNLRIIKTVLGSDSGARMESDPTNNNRIIVFGTASQHSAIKQALSNLDSDPVASKPFTERVYNGKTLEQWRNLLEFETNSSEVEEAANGIQALVANHPELLKSTRQWIVSTIIDGKANDWCERLTMRIGLGQEELDEIDKFIAFPLEPDIQPSQVIKIAAILYRAVTYPNANVEFNLSDWLSGIDLALGSRGIQGTPWADKLAIKIDELLGERILATTLSEIDRDALFSFIKEHPGMDFNGFLSIAANSLAFASNGSFGQVLGESEKAILFEIALRNSIASRDDYQSWLKQLNYAAKFIPANMSTETRD